MDNIRTSLLTTKGKEALIASASCREPSRAASVNLQKGCSLEGS